jgi:uncharacterized protein HemX
MPNEISSSSTSAASQVRKAQSKTRLVSLLFVIVILAIGYFAYSQMKLARFEKEWQAVFLTNGQVYFGQVKSRNWAEVIMEDIYYLQVTRPLQQTEEGQEAFDEQGELSLVKLGNELHGPTDKMYINQKHVLFLEDLKDDSNVVQAIINYKRGL